jgi:putative oxidoreductase
MKIAAIVVRILMGLLFVFASVAFFLKFGTPPPLEGAMKTFSEGMEASGYMLPTVKTIELFCGMALLTGLFVPLATVLLAPIIVNIVLVHAFLDPKGLPIAVFVLLGELFLAYVHRESYRPLFKPRP